MIFTPTFALGAVATTADAIKGFDAHLQRPSGLATLQAFLPNQTGVLWLSLMIMSVAGFDYSQPRSGRNLDLLLAQALGWCFMGSLDLLTAAVTFNDPAYRELIRLAFVAVTILTGTLAARTLWRRFRPQPEPAPSALPINILTVLAVFTVVLNLCVVFMHVPDDSSYFTSLGGQRLRERGALPCGDPMLTNTAGAAYAPLMYWRKPPPRSRSSSLPTLSPRIIQCSANTRRIERRPACRPRSRSRLFSCLRPACSSSLAGA